MGSHSLPSPPAEEQKLNGPRKSTSPSTKPPKSTQRAAKRASSGAAAVHHHDQVTHNTGMDGRHKRVWKACERCRMKKTKCDGEFPCKRCKDDGLVCTAGVRKKMEYKQLPRGYAEVLENTQFALIATVHKLYTMVRNNQSWELGEPELNDRGQPVIHNIAQKLGCIRPNSDIDLPVHSVFPEDEAGMNELARQLEEQQQQHEAETKVDIKDSGSPIYGRAERASSSELDHSDIEFDYRRAAFGQNSLLTMSPQSYAGSADFDFNTSPTDIPTSAPMFPSPTMPSFSEWDFNKTPQMDTMTMQLLQQAGLLQNMEIPMNSFGTIKPNVLSPSANPGVMLGMADPMIFANYEDETMRL